jgi:glycine reductase
MDPEGQDAIKSVVEKYDHDKDLLVLLGSPNADSAEVYAETVTTGDPAFAGALAGVQLKLDVYHILEPEIKALIDPNVYQKEIGVMENVLDVEEISKAVSTIRNSIK